MTQPPLRMDVRVVPRSRESRLEELPDGTWKARLKSPPVDGRANLELVSLIAEHFKCRKADVGITSGAGSRSKRVIVQR